MKIEFFKHNIESKDISEAQKVMHTLFLTTGPRVTEFEKKFAAYCGMQEAVGMNSCTGALHLALARHNIAQGDEVITTPMTFVATATAILQSGAIPVFADVDSKTGLLTVENVKKVISAKTKAIIVVHLYGRMGPMKEFAKLARQHKLVLIEDAAHCIEGVRDDVRPGQLSQAACYSFYATKNITCGEGGAITCNSKEDADWYRSARHHGISKNAASRYTKKYEHWDMEMMGWKYNMDDIKAALLINQLDRIDQYRKMRQEREELYRRLLGRTEGLDFLEAPPKGEISGHHLFTVLLPKKVNRDEVILQLQQKGIGCAVNYRAIHNLQYFRKKYGYKTEDFPIANEIGNRTISLPLYPKLSLNSVKYVCDTLIKILTMK